MATVSLLLFCCCAPFVPLPYAVSPAKDSSVPYPCMNRPCGCDSAEQCWRNCCCFSNQQKVEWAKKHSVTLPNYVLAAAKRESIASVSQEKPACPHCVQTQKSVVSTSSNSVLNCQTTNSKTKTKTAAKTPAVQQAGSAVKTRQQSPSDRCCESGTCASCDDSASTKVVQTTRKYLYGLSAQQCRGMQSLWLILSMSMMPEAVTVANASNADESYLQWTIPLLWECERAAPEPPPRLG